MNKSQIVRNEAPNCRFWRDSRFCLSPDTQS